MTTIFNRVLSFSTFFFVAMAIMLLFIWTPYTFLSGDGPCHLYNANILESIWQGDTKFYDHYYQLSRKLNPNWLGHILLAAFIHFFPAVIAEKILITLYAVMTVTGFWLTGLYFWLLWSWLSYTDKIETQHWTHIYKLVSL